MTSTVEAEPNRGKRSLSVVGLFAGIGGIELGLHEAGHRGSLLCEIDASAQTVLRNNFPGIPIHDDVSTLRSIPGGTDLIAAGFPCQDISLAGTRAGLSGGRSGLIGQVFRIASQHRTELILLENVQHLLRLKSGENLRIILQALEEMGYRWAYRVVDTRGFGLPQRRLRVIILASRGEVEPGDILFSAGVRPDFDDRINLELGHRYGFYWTEGKRGVGWARDAVPPIKGGSGLGIPSPPAVFDTVSGVTGTPSLEDAERLQGFAAGWTDVSEQGIDLRPGERWKLVGNAVSVPVGEWLGAALADQHTTMDRDLLLPFDENRAWPNAAMVRDGRRYKVEATTHVNVSVHTPIGEFLLDPLKPLSTKALLGYLSRARSGEKTFPADFLEMLQAQASSQIVAA